LLEVDSVSISTSVVQFRDKDRGAREEGCGYRGVTNGICLGRIRALLYIRPLFWRVLHHALVIRRTAEVPDLCAVFVLMALSAALLLAQSQDDIAGTAAGAGGCLACGSFFIFFVIG